MPRGLFWGNPEKVEQWLSARPTRNPIIEYLREGFDFGDMYGSTVSILFAIADVLAGIDIELIPTEWQYYQSPFGADIESWEYQAIIAAMRDSGATLENLEHAAKVFERLDRMNRLTGLEY